MNTTVSLEHFNTGSVETTEYYTKICQSVDVVCYTCIVLCYYKALTGLSEKSLVSTKPLIPKISILCLIPKVICLSSLINLCSNCY